MKQLSIGRERTNDQRYSLIFMYFFYIMQMLFAVQRVTKCAECYSQKSPQYQCTRH